MRWIDKLLNRLGYYKSEMPKGDAVSEGDILEMMGSYGENEMFRRYLRDLCAQDIRLYFQADNDRDRHTIRGAYTRCNYFLSLIQKSNDKQNRRRKGGG